MGFLHKWRRQMAAHWAQDLSPVMYTLCVKAVRKVEKYIAFRMLFAVLSYLKAFL